MISGKILPGLSHISPCGRGPNPCRTMLGICNQPAHTGTVQMTSQEYMTSSATRASRKVQDQHMAALPPSQMNTLRPKGHTASPSPAVAEET